jgi:starch synthase
LKSTILHITSEVAPFYKRGGLGDVLGALPKYLTNDQYDHLVVCPYYKDKMNLDENQCEKSVHFMEIFGIDYEFHNHAIVKDGVHYYFLNLVDDHIYASLEMSNDGDQPYKGGASFMYYLYFAQSILTLIEAKQISVSHILCHDWQSAGIFAFRDQLQSMRLKHNLVTTFVIHNYDFQGSIFRHSLAYLPAEIVKALMPLFDEYRSASMLALGVKYADYVATVSPTYAQELLSGSLPHKGRKFLKNTFEILSFLNGVDYNIWHPEKSPFLKERYSSKTLYKKKEIKGNVIQKCRFGLGIDQDTPLVLMMSRLTFQKGVQLFITGDDRDIAAEMEQFLGRGLALIINGSPSSGLNGHTHKKLSFLQSKFEGRIHYDPCYEEAKAHEYLAAADMIIVPSLFEPCGLVQIYAMAFGTIPIVRPVGGLKDTVLPHQQSSCNSLGFHVEEFTSASLRNAVHNAVTVYKESPNEWFQIVERCMEQDFSWNKMTRPYFDFLLSSQTTTSQRTR